MKRLILFFILIGFVAMAWAAPGSPPLDGVGSDGAQGLIIQGDTITIGGSNSAIKDNAGTLQISNGGGAFTNIGTASASISDAAYDATTWDGVTTDGASKNAIRDKIEALDAAKQDTLSTVSQAVAEAGTSTTAVLYTPERVAQAIAALGNDLSETDIDTLAELNAILTDATLLDDGAIADSTAIGLNTGATYTNFGGATDDSLNEMFAAIDSALATAGGDDLGSASAADVAALFSGSGTYLKSDGSQGDPVDWTADQGGAEVHANNLPANAADSAGIVASGAAQVNKVWKTDADGIPAWRDDSTGGTPTFDTVGTGTNVTSTMTVGAGGTLTYSGSGVLNASQYKGSGTPSATEFGYLSGVTSAIQTQLNGKQAASANLDGWSALATSAKQDASANLSGWSAIATSAKQDADTELSALAGLTSAANALPYFTGSGTAATTTMTAAGRALLDDNDAAAMRTTLGLAIGTNVQAYDADLTTYAGITPSANVQSLLGAETYSAMRTQLSLVPGTNVQAYDAELAALAGLTSAANALPYFTGSGTAAVTTLSTAGRALIDDASASDQRTTLGLAIGTDVQAYSAHLDDLSDGTLTGSKVDAATTSAVGVVELSTDAESVTGTSDAVVVTPGTLTARLAAPGAIGGTTPNAGTFTTLNAGGTGFAVDADGDTTVKSLNIGKTSGVAGSFLLKEANLLDEDGAGFKGPASVAANTSYQGQFPNARPSSDNSVMAWSDTASGGDGTPGDPFVHPVSFISLDNYLALAGGTMTGPLVTAVSATGGAGINIPHGTAPTEPDNGDLWTTTSGVYARINGATVGPFGSSAWYAYDVLPIAWAADGTAAPDALDDRDTRKPYQYRTFAHDSTEDVNFVWFVPSDLSGDTTAIQYRVKYLVTAATGPSNEGLAFTLAGVSLGDNDATNGTKGTAVTVTDTAITAAQHDILITDWSGDVTVTNLAAGEIAELAFTRDHDHASDDYAQVVGVLAVEIRYVRNVAR